MNSKNPLIQALMDEVEQIDAHDPRLELKLQLIAEKIATEQQKVLESHPAALVNDDQLIDPADVFACEGCQ